jgi:hypothetical protein
VLISQVPSSSVLASIRLLKVPQAYASFTANCV